MCQTLGYGKDFKFEMFCADLIFWVSDVDFWWEIFMLNFVLSRNLNRFDIENISIDMNHVLKVKLSKGDFLN